MMLKSIFAKISVFFDNSFEFGVYSDAGDKPAVWAIPGDLKNLSYLKAQNAGWKHIFVRPLPCVTDNYMLVDDLDNVQMQKHLGKPGRLIIESSPENFQVWIYSERPLTLDEKRFWLDKLGSDPGADPNRRWGRCPGFTNQKHKYRREAGFPYAKLISVDLCPAKIPAVPVLLQKTTPENNIVKIIHETHCIDYSDDISRGDYDSGDDSVSDFRYAMALVKRGCSDDEIKSRLLHERENWRHHQGGHRQKSYLDRTIRKARMWTK